MWGRGLGWRDTAGETGGEDDGEDGGEKEGVPAGVGEAGTECGALGVVLVSCSEHSMMPPS